VFLILLRVCLPDNQQLDSSFRRNSWNSVLKLSIHLLRPGDCACASDTVHEGAATLASVSVSVTPTHRFSAAVTHNRCAASPLILMHSADRGFSENISKMILQLKKTYFSNYHFLYHETKFTVHYSFKAEI